MYGDPRMLAAIPNVTHYAAHLTRRRGDIAAHYRLFDILALRERVPERFVVMRYPQPMARLMGGHHADCRLNLTVQPGRIRPDALLPQRVSYLRPVLPEDAPDVFPYLIGEHRHVFVGGPRRADLSAAFAHAPVEQISRPMRFPFHPKAVLVNDVISVGIEVDDLICGAGTMGLLVGRVVYTK